MAALLFLTVVLILNEAERELFRTTLQIIICSATHGRWS